MLFTRIESLVNRRPPLCSQWHVKVCGNVFFNGPRAGVNFNDGFGGGNIMTRNLLFNYVRETGDHGPFNAWDSQPFVLPSSACNKTSHNFVIDILFCVCGRVCGSVHELV